jgi:hypothetical protein
VRQRQLLAARRRSRGTFLTYARLSPGFTISKRTQAMDHVSREMHERAIGVAVAGAVLGVLSLASLSKSSDRQQSLGRPTLTYSAGDVRQVCAAAQTRTPPQCNIFAAGTSAIVVAERGAEVDPN